MGYKPYEGFEPKWIKEAAPADSYRSIFRWGDPNHFKFPKESLYKLMKERLDIDDTYVDHYRCDTGLEPVDFKGEYAPKMAKEHLDFFASIYGDQMSQSDYDRLSVAYGQTAYDLYRIRERQFDSLPDVVLY